MHFPKTLTSSIVLFFLLSAMGCASTSDQEGTGEYFDDTWITTKVKAVLIKDPVVKSAEVNVETFKGVVQLSGFVGSDEAMVQAVKLAEGIDGVTAVLNDMRVK